MAGIYIHIPFCRQACTYCNFHFSTSLALKDQLLNAIQEEIILTAGAGPANETIETIYIGGGTPSLLSWQEVETLLQNIHLHFTVSEDAEITLEANPDDINKTLLQQWKQIGINRLSLGLQSFNEAELKWMNRAHTAAEALQSIALIQEADFTNFSVDLIYGSPLQSNEQLLANLQFILNKNIPHVSAYALTVEPKTALAKMISQQNSQPIDEAHQATQFEILVDQLEKAGYQQYEISNFAKPGYRSRHNSSYWQGKPYYGFGPAAHSFDGKNIRRWNISNNALYIKSLEGRQIPFEEEILTDEERLNEYLMIALRTAEGIDLSKIAVEFGDENAAYVKEKAHHFITEEKLIHQQQSITLSNKGKFFADGIAASLFL